MGDKMKIATILAVVAITSSFTPELSEAKNIYDGTYYEGLGPDDYSAPKEPEEEPPKCNPGEVLKPSMTGGLYCTPKKTPWIKCNGKEAGECQKLCKGEKDCAHLTHCDHGACNDQKSCKTRKDCESFGYTETSGARVRTCKDKGEGKKCYFDEFVTTIIN